MYNVTFRKANELRSRLQKT